MSITGANGFLGWHLRAALRERGDTWAAVALGDAFDRASAIGTVSGSSRLVHLAGVNRGTDTEVADGNVRFATQAAEALLRAGDPPATVVFANSTQSTGESVYGGAKSEAADILRRAASEVGAEFRDILLPNLFGEHGTPFYNAVTATFCHLLAQSETPTVDDDKTLTLMHAQDAADMLAGTIAPAAGSDFETEVTVGDLLRTLTEMSATYRMGEIPDVASAFDRNLFNTYRSHTFPAQAPIRLARHADSRGSFFEIIRSHGGGGQSSFSTTEPGISRGDHFHRRKIERFAVLSGTARISLRRLFSPDVYEFDVDGGEPVAVDMPTMWSHNITNTGSDTLFTSFWANEIFDADAPDTIAEVVHQ